MTSDAQPGASGSPAPSAPAPAGPVLRTLDLLTGLFAAGMVVFGVGLLHAQLLAPALLSAAGWGAATGPGWARVLAHLLVGLIGEIVVRARHRWPGPIRVAADLAVVGAAVVVVAWAWWP